MSILAAMSSRMEGFTLYSFGDRGIDGVEVVASTLLICTGSAAVMMTRVAIPTCFGRVISANCEVDSQGQVC